MREFINIVENAQAPLYHFTTFKFAKWILIDGYIKGSSSIDPVISVTRDKNLSFYQSLIRFNLDTDRIKTKYKITPHNYWPSGLSSRSESEERIYADKLPLAYVSSITLMPIKGSSNTYSMKWNASDEIISLANQRNIPIIDNRGERPTSLDEAFNSNQTISWEPQEEKGLTAKFTVDSIEVLVHFSKSLRHEDTDEWSMLFQTKGLDGHITTVNTGLVGQKAPKVFAGVVYCIEEFLQKTQPDYLCFSGSHSAKKSTLYKKMSNVLSPRLKPLGYKMLEPFDGDIETDLGLYCVCGDL